MNPPRFELGYAVRRFFAAHGIIIKKSHVTPVSGETAASAAGDAVRRKRRRRKRSKNAGTEKPGV